ncbi:MAG: hypothetical protein IT497_10425 [Ottowia sp.]|nr:hypothetical protein [Ottowia sp.]
MATNRQLNISNVGGVSKVRKKWLHKIHLMADEISREPQIPEIAYKIAELNSLAYENVANIIQEKFIEANAIKETPNKKNADQHWQLLKRIVLGGKSMGRNYLPERLASRLSGKMSYVFQKGFREWLLSNQKDATAAAEFFPSNEEGEAFFEKRKSLINEEHYFSFLKNSNFLEWMHSEYLPDRLCFSDNYKPDIDEIEQALCNYFGIKGITYLTAEQRSPLEVKAQRKGFFDISGKIFSTEKMSIGENEAGWAAYVLSPQNKLYIHSHIPGKFHHSSFLSGLPVQAAGTIKINSKGKLIAITPKSGHYRSTPEMFAKILDSLHKRGVDLRGVAAQPDIFSPDYYDAYEIMLAGGAALENMSKINI